MNGEVMMVDGVKAAVRAYCEAGFVLETADESAGGTQLPGAGLSVYLSQRQRRYYLLFHSWRIGEIISPHLR